MEPDQTTRKRPPPRGTRTAEVRHRNALPEGHVLYWYRIQAVLGQGGFGITYRAFDTNLQRIVAIKEYLPSGVAVRERNQKLHPISEEAEEHYHWGFERFVAEARVLAHFNHPNIVRVLNVFEANNTAYIVMEYEAGRSLMALVRQGIQYSEPAALELAAALMSGLEQVHDAGFVHRDVKPGNILVSESSPPVLIDFGSARFAMSGKTQLLTAVVSPGYAPYEQYEGTGDRQGPWTDIYGLGATLYVLASGGKRPVDAIGRGNARLQGQDDPYVSAAAVGRRRYSARFLRAIDAALAFSGEDRPQSVAEWRALFPGLDAPRAAMAGALPRVAPGARWASRLAARIRAAFARDASLDERRPTPIVTERLSIRSHVPVGARTPGTVFRDPLAAGGEGPEMIVVPGGAFEMGDASGAGTASERPMHPVNLAEPFAIGVAPVTFDDYDPFARLTGRALPDDHGWGRADRPAVNVSWRDARAYVDWLVEQTGIAYRLPSEAEWEYAARAGTRTRYWWGDEVGEAQACCDGCGSPWDGQQSSPIGSFPANAFGLVDTLGNVWEWVEDAWHQDYVGAPADGSAWAGGNGSLRVARGGAWNYVPRHTSCASRVSYTVDHRSSNLGFRVALTL